jgi:hypothetical protein
MPLDSLEIMPSDHVAFMASDHEAFMALDKLAIMPSGHVAFMSSDNLAMNISFKDDVTVILLLGFSFMVRYEALYSFVLPSKSPFLTVQCL